MSRDGSVRGVLVNSAEGRLRAGWRLVAATGLLVAALVASVRITAALGGLDVAAGTGPASLAGVAVFALPTAALLVAARLLDRRTLAEFGLSLDRDWWADLLAGFAVGACAPVAIFAAEYALGFVRITAVPGGRAPAVPGGPRSVLGTLALAFAYFVGVGVFEELLFRGYLLTNAAEGLAGLASLDPDGAVLIATAATSLLFGLAHGLNPNATPIAVGLIALYGGLLAAGYLLTGRLAIPVGVHVAWNFTVTSVLGFPVSGFAARGSLLAIEQSGPTLVTGGRFGPEGGLVSLLGLAVGVALLLAWIRRREGSIRVHPRVARPPPPSGGDGPQ